MEEKETAMSPGRRLQSVVNAFVGDDDIIITRMPNVREPDSVVFRIPVFEDANRSNGRGCLCVDVISHPDGYCDIRGYVGDGIDSDMVHYMKLCIGSRRADGFFSYVRKFISDRGLGTQGTSVTGTVIYLRAVSVHFLAAIRILQSMVTCIVPLVTDDLRRRDDRETEREYIDRRLSDIRTAIANSRRGANAGD